jgi:hypothetical protein
MSKLHLSLAVAAAVTALAWWWAGIPGTGSAADAPQGHGALAASNPEAHVALPLPQRALSAPPRDLFGVPIKPPAPRIAVTEVAQAPKAPPLPYQYDGSGQVQGQSFVFLRRQDRSFRVSPGDTIEGTYSVEAVARDHVVLRYLPLGVRQVLMYQPGAEPPPEIVAVPGTREPVVLRVAMPSEVALGQEFVVTLALPGAGAVKATVEVSYDAEVLGTVGADVRRPGRAVVDMASGSPPRAQLRFRVLADAPASTDIDLEVNATDASGKRVPVSIPPTHSVSLVAPGA